MSKRGAQRREGAALERQKVQRRLARMLIGLHWVLKAVPLAVSWLLRWTEGAEVQLCRSGGLRAAAAEAGEEAAVAVVVVAVAAAAAAVVVVVALAAAAADVEGVGAAAVKVAAGLTVASAAAAAAGVGSAFAVAAASAVVAAAVELAAVDLAGLAGERQEAGQVACEGAVQVACVAQAPIPREPARAAAGGSRAPRSAAGSLSSRRYPFLCGRRHRGHRYAQLPWPEAAPTQMELFTQ